MKSQSASLTKAEKDRMEAQRYMWHFKASIRDTFDHSHWWTITAGPPAVEAMVWEIFRRHPDTYELFIRHQKGLALLGATSEPTKSDLGADLAIARAAQAGERLLLAANCFDSWPKLPKPEQRYWRRFFREKVKPQRGVHPSAVIVLNEYRKTAILKRKAAKIDANENRSYLRYMAALVITQPNELLHDCAEHDEKGRILLAIEPTAPPGQIAAAVEAAIKVWPHALKLPEIGKNRLDQCLAVIAAFEGNELGTKPAAKGTRINNLPAQYRRVIKPWSCAC